jgi:hypothetical protein
MKSVKIIFALLLCSAFFQIDVLSQSNYPQLPLKGSQINDFVPAEWEVIKEISGDLNDDKVADTVLIIKGTDAKLITKTEPTVGKIVKDEKTGETEFLLDGNPRILVVLLKEKDGFKLAEQNNSLIPPLVYPTGETLESVKIDESGDLEIKLSFMDRKHGFLYRTEIFEFPYSKSDSAFYLFRAYQTLRERNSKETLEKHFVLNRYLAEFNTYSKYEGSSGGTWGTPLNFDMVDLPRLKAISSWESLEKEVDRLKVKPPQVDAGLLAQMTEDKQVMFYDGRVNADPYSNLIKTLPTSKTKSPQGFTEMMNREIISQSFAIKKLALKDVDYLRDWEKFDCPQQKQPILKTVEGSFTQPNVKQTASLYKLYACGSNAREVIGGIIIAEGDKIVTHYVYASTWLEYADMQIAPDMNQNGLTEIILSETTGRDEVEILEIPENKMNFLGHISGLNDFRRGIHTFGLNGERTDYPSNYWGDVISVVPGKTPYFFRKKYFRRGNEEWKAENKAELISLSPAANSLFNVFRQMK